MATHKGRNDRRCSWPYVTLKKIAQSDDHLAAITYQSELNPRVSM